MGKRTKSVKIHRGKRISRKRHQKGGFWNNLKKMVGLSGGDESQIQQPPPPTSESNGILGSVSNIFGNITQQGENLLGNAESFIGEKSSQFSNTVSSGITNLREKGAKMIAPAQSSDQSNTPEPAQVPVEQVPVEQVPVEQVPQSNLGADVNYSNPSGGNRRKKKSMKGGDLSSTAAPVQGLKVAKPTYWMSGGRRRKYSLKKNKRTRNKSCKK